MLDEYEPAVARPGEIAVGGWSMSVRGMLALLRPKQWIKNAFVGAPLFFTPDLVARDSVLAVAAGTGVFCLAASAIYCLNDLRDREADRNHPLKRNRPIASGAVGVGTAIAVMLALLALAGAGTALLVPRIATVLGAYLALNLAYSFGLKSVAILDVLIVAFGFVLRIEAGGRLIGVDPSAWILIVTGLLALFIALAKRRDDLARDLDSNHRRSLEGYTKAFLDASLMAVLAMLLVSYLIFTTDTAVMARLGTHRLYFTAPFVIAGVLRYLQLTLVYERSGSPTDLVYRDPGLQLSVAGWLATFAFILYL